MEFWYIQLLKDNKNDRIPLASTFKSVSFHIYTESTNPILVHHNFCNMFAYKFQNHNPPERTLPLKSKQNVHIFKSSLCPAQVEWNPARIASCIYLINLWVAMLLLCICPVRRLYTVAVSLWLCTTTHCVAPCGCVFFLCAILLFHC